MIHSMARQMYDYYIRPYIGEKGQDLVEYAILLAIIVAVGYLIFKQDDLKSNISSIFTSAKGLSSQAAQSSSVPPASGSQSGNIYG